ncbi:putative Tetratricopeptide TPR_1 repeat-containing protein [Candidatus Sulfotelmatobacter kueseliae]|uniref:Putative Tetratricopeptide TPR_1 repeat-containing protein n=1 Tax=Candidatus Sulfotelmatobacter kueseliae TaxID=2042962 RepID=A0A2U3K3H4_9BACT|nr:putative Tetratricopeptide TPR_1 repeat-containing protein [Candidatus Sulfotelmatobacter kueseliae]
MKMRTVVAFLLMSSFIAGQAGPDLTAVLRQGARLVDQGKLSAAQELYEKELGSYPDDPDLRLELGMVYFRQRNWAKAAENYQASLAAAPGKIKPLYYLAEAYFMESDLDRARDTIAEAARIAPDDAQVCQKYGEYLSATIERRKEGLAWLQKARRLNPGLARIDFQIGKTEFDLTDYRSATSSLETALKKDSSDGQAAFYLAESWASLGDWEKAQGDYNYALAHGHADGPTYYGLGRALVELGKPDAALAPLQRAIVVQPSLSKAHFQLGKAYRELGRSKEAQYETRLFSAMTDRIDTSNELNGPEEEDAWKRVKPLLEANQEQEALELLAKLPVADVLDHGEPHYLLGTMYYSLGRKDDAKRMLNIARTLAPKSSRIVAYLGMVELSSGETVAAEESFQSALTLDSAEVLALIGMGSIRYQQKRWADATEYLEKSRTADIGALFMLCDADFRVGRTEDALLTAEVIRALGAGQQPLLDELEKLVRLHQTEPAHMVP